METDLLSHTGDPWTSGHAAVKIDAAGRATMKDAILLLIAEQPRTGDELARAYATNAEANRWPLTLDLHNIKRRMSELHTIHHVIRDSGEHRISAHGRPAVVWELAVPLEEARLVVAS